MLFHLTSFFVGQPTGENGATRAPISVDLSRDSSVSSKSIVLQIDNKSQQVSASNSLYKLPLHPSDSLLS